MGAPRGTITERLWRRVTKTETCWLWNGLRNKNGYGVIKRADGGLTTTHRVAWISTHGNIADGLCVCHHCDNPRCVRPEHLFLGTNTDNVRDKTTKGRQAIGEANPNARFTPKTVRAIRARHAGGESIIGLARTYGVAFNSIWQIVHRKTWTHVR